MAAETGNKQCLKKDIPYEPKYDKDGKFLGFVLDKDVMDVQAYNYRITNLKLQKIRIGLSCTSIAIGVAIFLFWVLRG